MTKQEFIKQGMARIGAIPDPGNDTIWVELCFTDCYLDGFSLDDAVAHTRLSEYVSPDLDEHEALARMKAIRDKYSPKERDLPNP